MNNLEKILRNEEFKKIIFVKIIIFVKKIN